MKLKKKSGLMGAVIALSAASLVSVGFASWVISQGANDTVQGTIYVDTVDDQRLSLEATIAGSPIRFGGMSDDDIAASRGEGGYLAGKTIWLSNNSADKENLDFSVELEITSTSANVPTTLSSYNISFDLVASNPTNYTAASETKGYVSTLDEVLATATVHGGATSLVENKVTYDFSFAWGSTFGNKNPYEFYNYQAFNDTLADDAKTKLGDLNTLLDGITFTLTVNVALI